MVIHSSAGKPQSCVRHESSIDFDKDSPTRVGPYNRPTEVPLISFRQLECRPIEIMGLEFRDLHCFKRFMYIKQPAYIPRDMPW